MIAPPTADGPFRVESDGIVFEGDVGSYIDREMYLYGQFERHLVDLFVEAVPSSRRGVLLDIGANVGTHTLLFRRAFGRVHAFEPNPALWAQFERNMALNDGRNVTLHKVGFGTEDADLPFYSIDKNNTGLGTFMPDTHYDMPLHQIGVLRVENGDALIEREQIRGVDAIKIDVQGAEPKVLAGLRRTLERDRPYVLLEFAAGRDENFVRADIEAQFPYATRVQRFETTGSVFGRTTRLVEVGAGETCAPADYVIAPA